MSSDEADMAIEDSSNTPGGLAVGAMVRFASKLSGELYRGIVYFYDVDNGSFGIDKVSHGPDIKSFDSAEGFFQFLVKDIKDFRVLVHPTVTITTKVDQKNNPDNALSSNAEDDHKKGGTPDDALSSNAQDEQKSIPGETTSSNTKDEQKSTPGEATSFNTTVEQKSTPGEATSSNTTVEQKSTPGEATSSNTTDEQKSTLSKTTSSNTTDEQKGSLGEASSSNTKTDQI